MATCEICGGVGLVRTPTGSRRCECQAEKERQYRLGRVGIPPAFAGATLAGFRPCPHTGNALQLARRYVAEFIPGQTKTGLLFSGSTGTGKTHLAVAIARQLAEEKGIAARFVDMNRLIDGMRSAAFDTDAEESRRQIMQPIYAADLLILDDLGAARSNDFVFEIVQSLVGRLYNDMRPAIVTTNLLNQAFDPKASQPTLGERIGERAYSRLQQMCHATDMTGPDYRRTRK